MGVIIEYVQCYWVSFTLGMVCMFLLGEWNERRNDGHEGRRGRTG